MIPWSHGPIPIPAVAPAQHRRDLCRDLAANARRLQEELGRAPGIRCQPLAGGPRAFPRIRIPPRARSQARVSPGRGQGHPGGTGEGLGMGASGNGDTALRGGDSLGTRGLLGTGATPG